MSTNSRNPVKPHQVRQISPTHRSVSGIYAFKGESSIAYESTLERDFLIRTEYFLDVLDVIPQPTAIPFKAKNGRQYTYTPDFLVYYRLGSYGYENYPKPMLVEVKPASEWTMHWRRWLPKWKAAYRHAKEQGWLFHIYDESRIRDQTFKNIKFLERYKRLHFPKEELRAVLESVYNMGAATMDHLLAKHFMGMYRAEGIALIWHLLATRQLDCEIHLPLRDSTVLWIAAHD